MDACMHKLITYIHMHTYLRTYMHAYRHTCLLFLSFHDCL